MLSHMTHGSDIADLLIVGGGVNGCGIARDAAGRGLSVTLAEQGDLAQGASSASTKLVHGGLRYLEHREFRLVREALQERETLLAAMPHICRPMRFVLPHHAGLRPAWLLRTGLFLYDHLGGRKVLPPHRALDLGHDPAGAPLKPEFRRGFEYSDCWVDDARLVALNARDAAERGAEILTRTRLERAWREGDVWRAVLRDMATGESRERRAKALVNAAGPWVEEVIAGRMKARPPAKARLVRGSHIVTRRLFEGDRAYIFQQSDGRIVFAIPYERDFTLIGTTEQAHEGDPGAAVCTQPEADYLREAVSGYLRRPVEASDIVWTYAGVRPLHDDGASNATQATRDYVLSLDAQGAPALHVFGGKITTFRRLAEAALAKLGVAAPPWTAGAPLPGGDFPHDGTEAVADQLRADHPFVGADGALRLARAYGTDAALMLDGAARREDMGRRFGVDLTEREVRWLMEREFARTAEDVLWRRSKLGLRVAEEEARALEHWMQAARQAPRQAAE